MTTVKNLDDGEETLRAANTDAILIQNISKKSFTTWNEKEKNSVILPFLLIYILTLVSSTDLYK